MRSICPFVVAALMLLAMPALAQTMSQPPASQPPDTPGTYLEAARLDISQGRLNDASVALEAAETRILTRSVVRSPQVQASNQPLIATIAQARSALASSDTASALAKIDEALRNPALNEPTR